MKTIRIRMNRGAAALAGAIARAAAVTISAAGLVAAIPAVALADTIEPTVIGPAELTVGQFVAIVACAVVAVAAGTYLLVRFRRRRRAGAGEDGPAADEDGAK